MEISAPAALAPPLPADADRAVAALLATAEGLGHADVLHGIGGGYSRDPASRSSRASSPSPTHSTP